MISPSFFSLHPLAVLIVDCGIGSDPDATECTGTYGPTYLSDTLTGQLTSGRTEILAVGAAFLALLALLVLIRMVRRPAQVAKRPGALAGGRDDVRSYCCRKCGAPLPADADPEDAECTACGFVGKADISGSDDDAEAQRIIDSLEPGQGHCFECGSTYGLDDSDGYQVGGVCPVCGAGGGDDESGTAAASDPVPVATAECSMCGKLISQAEADEHAGACGDCWHGFDEHGLTAECAVCGKAITEAEADDNAGACNACWDEFEERGPDGVGSSDGFR